MIETSFYKLHRLVLAGYSLPHIEVQSFELILEEINNEIVAENNSGEKKIICKNSFGTWFHRENDSHFTQHWRISGKSDSGDAVFVRKKTWCVRLEHLKRVQRLSSFRSLIEET